jgi:hypothetical protein
MQTKVHLFVDASNFARQESGGASLERLLSAVSSLRLALQDRDHEIVMIADSGLWKRFGPQDRARYDKMIRENEIIRSDSGVEADIPLLELARKHNGHVVTGDGFRDHERFHAWVDAPQKARLIGGVRDPIDGAWLFTERLLRKKSQHDRGRDLSQVLDDIYPTIQSIARNMTVAVQDTLALVEGTEIPYQPTAILSRSHAEQVRQIIREAAEFNSSLASIMNKSEMQPAEFLRWLEYKRIKYVKRDLEIFVTTQSLQLVRTWLDGSLRTLLAWKLFDAVASNDVVETRRLINDLDFEGQDDLVSFGRACISIEDISQPFNWATIKTLQSDLFSQVVELVHSQHRIDALILMPTERIGDIRPQIRLRVLHAIFTHQPDFDSLSNFLAAVDGEVDEGQEMLDNVASWITKEAFESGYATRWSKRKWKLLADQLRNYPGCITAHAVCMYYSGNELRVISGLDGCDKRVITRLRKHFLEVHLESPWLSEDDLGMLLLNSSIRKHLSERDYQSFVLSHEVLDIAVRRLEQIIESESHWVDLILVHTVERELGLLLNSIQNASQSMENIASKVVGNG